MVGDVLPSGPSPIALDQYASDQINIVVLFLPLRILLSPFLLFVLLCLLYLLLLGNTSVLEN